MGVALEVRDVTVTFNAGTPNEVVALRDASLRVAPGEFIVVIGGNGSGKSTLLRAVAGAIRPATGAIFIDNRDVTGVSDYRRARDVSFVYQDPLLGTCPNLTLHENIMLAHTPRHGGWWRPLPYPLHAPKRQFEIIEAIGLGLERRLVAPLSTFSGGQRQAIALAIAFSRKAPLMLLDEYLSSLDESTADKVLDFTLRLAREEEPTILLVIHDLDRALRLAKRTIVLRDGRIVDDLPPNQMLRLQRRDLVTALQGTTKH